MSPNSIVQHQLNRAWSCTTLPSLATSTTGTTTRTTTTTLILQEFGILTATDHSKSSMRHCLMYIHECSDSHEHAKSSHAPPSTGEHEEQPPTHDTTAASRLYYMLPRAVRELGEIALLPWNNSEPHHCDFITYILQ
ncbi:unnamed protein product [Amoebophrya sp. A120]|nr:unnamed protein product [Amoebophrya sp. A120]|eukprot:GSA120T00012220001.1